jgi:hypothetical protein
MQKNYKRQNSLGSQKSFKETAPSPSNRYQSYTDIKSYKDFLKLYLSPRKQVMKAE